MTVVMMAGLHIMPMVVMIEVRVAMIVVMAMLAMMALGVILMMTLVVVSDASMIGNPLFRCKWYTYIEN